MNTPLLVARQWGVSHGQRPILRDVNFDIAARSLTSIVGPSGVGKTTLLRSLNRLLDEDPAYRFEGQILLERECIHRQIGLYSLRRAIGIVFQKPVVFPTTIYKNVIFGTKHLQLAPKGRYDDVVERYLKQAFLWDEVKDRLHEPAKHLSLGQQQRLTMARTLAVEPQVILMDEPTASLDQAATEKIEELILHLKTEKTILLVTHDLEQATRLGDQSIRLMATPTGATTASFMP